MSDAVLREVKDGLVTLTLNRADKLNALSFECFKDLAAASITPARISREIGCVLLKGAGRSFCAGNDLGGLGGVFNEAATVRASAATRSSGLRACRCRWSPRCRAIA